MSQLYINSFKLTSSAEEVDYILSWDKKMTMTCYSDTNIYPYKVFPLKGLEHIDFSPITVFYGGNGSGKSTLLNIIAEKLGLERSAPFNNTPFFEEYLKTCDYELTYGGKVPRGSRIITSDDVFDFLLDLRSINDGIDERREELFSEYMDAKYNSLDFKMRSLDDYDELKRRNEARNRTKSVYVNRRLPKNVEGRSNGESALAYFTEKIKGDALYLLDEPENSLSAVFQQKMAKFIEESVRFYRCQFVISTHSPFLLALKGARIYDLDSRPVKEKPWHELENIRLYFELFDKHKDSFIGGK